MKRMKYDHLLFTKNRFYEKEGLFTGVAYQENNGVISHIDEIVDGVITGPYSNKYLPDDKTQLCVNASLLDNPNGDNLDPYLYEGKLFNGISCDFHKGVCIEECYYNNGEKEVIINYSISGAMTSLLKYEVTLFQEYKFFESGQLSTVSLERLKKFRMKVRFSRDGEVHMINISKDYFEWMPRIEADIIHNLLPTKESLSGLTVAKQLRLLGDGITCDVVNQLAACNTFSSIENLELLSTSIDPDCTGFLDRLNNIQSIELEDERDQMAETAKMMKLKHPTTKVLFNDKELLLDIRFES